MRRGDVFASIALAINYTDMKLTNTASKSLVALAALVAIGAGAGISAIASAATSTDASVTATSTKPWVKGAHGGPGMGRGRGVHGTVSAINGSTLTITNTDGTSYTVDASQAKVSKVIDLTFSDIQVGDSVGVQGKVSGSSVTASHIMDGVPQNQAPPAGN